jgi:hypothetical protein
MLNLLFTLVLSTASHALLGNCNLPEPLNGEVAINFDAKDVNAPPKGVPGFVTSVLVLNGDEIPAMREQCVYQNVPGQRSFMCAHHVPGSATRYDVYPRFEKANGHFNGTLKKVQIIRWTSGGAPATFESEDCR